MDMAGTMRYRRLTFAFAIALMAAFLPGVAHASGPAVVPTQIMSEGFEGALPSRLVLDWALPSPGDPSPAYWGVITQQKHAGARGLWCAGSIPNSSSTTAWTTFGGLYQPYTAGLATFALPELADYYSAKLEFWYRMPTIGSADGDSFNVLWSATSGSSLWDYHVGWPVTSSWTYASFDMSLPTAAGHTRPLDLSRTAGQVRFQFIDSTGDVYESPSTGEGPTIDDVTVSGYKFGPVRGLDATVTADGLHLSWTVPARSTALAAADEERPIAYRVYRELDGSNVWSELSTDRIAGTSFDDADASALSGTYRYVVQAWDPAGGPGYGQVVLPADSVTYGYKRASTAPAFTITGVPAGPTNASVVPGIATTTTAPSVAATLDGAAFAWGGAVSTEGTHTLFVRVTNSDGAASIEQAVFVIDKTAPVTTCKLPSGTQLAPVTITLTAADALSGVDGIVYRLDGARATAYTAPLRVTTWGDHTLYYGSVDKAGNQETIHVIHFSMRQPTTLSISSPSTARRYHHVTVYGYLSPGKKGEKVTLSYQRPGSSRWYSSTRYTVASGSKGKWTYTISPSYRGTYHFKVSYAGSSTKYKSASTTRNISVR
jgi:hypothetical protein